MAAKKKNMDTVNEPTQQETAEQASAQEPAEAESYTLSKEEFLQVQERIARLQQEKEETVALLQRNQADFENFRRRNAQIRKDSYEDGKRDCITELLAVMDDLDRVTESSAGDAAWLDGIRLVQKKLHTTLEKLGLEEIAADGKFDANLHNAVMSEKAEGQEPGTILCVLQKGYRVGDRIIRYAMVKVAE